MTRFRILISNDDGIHSEGLRALTDAMDPLADVWVVAPEVEQSASSHAISLNRPLRIKELKPRWYAVDGTPTDCAYLGINQLMKGARPHLLVSGINHGANMAEDVTYSGTVAAAMEASILGVPAMAFSLASRRSHDFGPAARFARAFVEGALGQPLPSKLLLNINIPPMEELRGYAITKLGRHSYGFEVIENTDPRGRKYYWIGGSEAKHENLPGSDCNAVLDEGLVSVTPLHLDLTQTGSSDELARWQIQGYPRHLP